MYILNARFSQNISVVHPEYFFISGLSGIPYSSYYYMFLFFIYIVAVIGNSIVLLIIAIDRSLHSPKYIGVFHLALADIGETNALIPNMMKTFLFESQYISYNACLANMFFVYFFNTIQCVSLVVLAFDRFVAICLPLRYHAIVNNAVMCSVFSIMWMLSTFLVGLTVSLVTRLSFCKSNEIQSYFCDHGPVYRMACNDNSVNSFMAKLNTAVYFAAPLIIFLSYLCIFFALSKITTWEGRIKALKTCVSHLLLVGVCFLPIICTYIAAIMLSLSTNVRVISTSLAYAVPPMLNPMIYVLNTAEVKNFIQTVIKKKSASIDQGISD
ncbi:olfactory receptor 1M1-like [Sinocyclocheilus grahami]|uniref:Olfactory receptor 1M1-like n=1 Tax=Sinocyclocheilus grahami TaxID=75366 RepID=A0A672Q7E1_SINGR|nr:PREDICTED: olfactory receptor 1M1-like [Sinocyclocheilus grahami]